MIAYRSRNRNLYLNWTFLVFLITFRRELHDPDMGMHFKPIDWRTVELIYTCISQLWEKAIDFPTNILTDRAIIGLASVILFHLRN